MTESDIHTERLVGGQNPSVEARRQTANQILPANDVRFRALWDVTTHKRQEEQRLLESVVEHLTDGVLVTEAAPLDPPGPRIVYVNQALTAIMGYTKQQGPIST